MLKDEWIPAENAKANSPFEVKSYDAILDEIKHRTKPLMSDSDWGVEIIIDKATLLLSDGKIKEATQLLEEIDSDALRMPKQVVAHTLLRQKIQIALGNHDQAISALENFASDPFYSPYLVNMLISTYRDYRIKGDTENAERHFQMGMKINPLCKPEFDKIDRKIDGEISTNPPRKKANRKFLKTTFSLLGLSRTDQAEDCLNFINQRTPEVLKSRAELQSILPSLRHIPQALQDIKNPDIGTESTTYKQALELALKIGEKLPDNYHALMARVEDSIRRFPQQIPGAVESLEKNYPHSPEAHNTLGRLYSKKADEITSPNNIGEKVRFIIEARLHMLKCLALHEVAGASPDEALLGEIERIQEELKCRYDTEKMREVKKRRPEIPKKSLSKLLQEGKYDEARRIMDDLIRKNQANKVIFIKRFQLALMEGDILLARKMFKRMERLMGEREIRRYHSHLLRAERGISTHPAVDHAEPSGSHIWEAIVERVPVNRAAAKITGYNKE